MAANGDGCPQHGYAVYTFYSQGLTSQNSQDREEHPSNVDDVVDGSKQSSQYRLSLLSSSLQAESETNLRTFLMKKLERPSFVEENVNIASLPEDVVFKGCGMVYFYILQNFQEGTEPNDSRMSLKRFLICFPVETESGLDLFSTELFAFCQSLGPHLQLYNESVDISEHLRVLGSWYDVSIVYIARVVEALKDDLAPLMYACFTGMCVDSSSAPEALQQDVKKFTECCSLSELLQDGTGQTVQQERPSESRMCTLKKEADGSYKLTYSCDVTAFCQEAAVMVTKMDTRSPFKLRQVIETFKLKVIQDMNAFKRLTKLAENDHYALFRSYRFLVACGNGPVLLHNAKQQTDLGGGLEILRAIEEHIQEEGGYRACKENNSNAVKVGS